MKIAFNPSTVAALIAPPNNKDITFDLRGHNIFARGVKFLGTDTNTWRDIKINNVSIDSNTLDLRNGSNTTLTNINGVVTINSTWRPVVDSLTSDSTTSSLSAKQGKVLKSLIDGKSDSGHNHDDRYVKKSGDTMRGALNFANGTWNLVGDDSYIGDCNISGHFGIKAANTTYPGIAFFNNSGTHLGNLTAYSGNIKYGAYSLQFLDNGNTSVNVSTWTNPFSAYNSNAVADGQAICVWGQASYLSNLANDTGDMSLWLKRVNAKAATLNMVLDGEYYANGNLRLAHVSEIPSSLKNPHALTISLNGTSQGPYDGSTAKNINITPSSIGAATSGHNHDDRYLKLTGGTMQLGEGLKFHADNNYFGTNADARIISLLDDNDKICDGGLIIDERGTLNGKEYVTELLRIRDSEFKWRGSNILHSGNSYINGSTITINGSSLNIIDLKVTLSFVSSGYTDFRAVLITAETSSSSAGYTPSTVTGKTFITNALQLSPQAGNLYLKGSAAIGTTNFNYKLNVNGDIGLLNTGSIRDLTIGGGIYWNPYVESNSDNTDAASITLVKSGVAGGTTLVLSLMNDANDTILFQTNGSARLYHNSYPILTTLNTYVNNHKGYINGTEITLVNNADTVDGFHASSLWRSDGATWNPGANVSLTASANNQEWSFDIRRNGYTGCYWHVWDSALNTLLKVNADNGKVYAPYNFVGNLEGNAYYATKSEYSRSLLGRSTSGSDYGAGSGNLVFAEWNTMNDGRWYLKATGYECRVAYANNAGDASRVYGQVGDTGSHELVRCDMNNDQFRIIAGSSGNNNGWAEIATADDGSEPIYVRQYSGVFNSVVRTLTLLDANGYTHFPSYINIGGNENNNSSPDRVWGSNGSDSYLRSYRTSALNVNYASSAGNADTVDGYHYHRFVYNSSFGYHRNGPYYKKIASVNTANWTWSSASLIFEVFSTGYSLGVCYLGTVEVTCGHWNNTDHNPSVICRWILKVPNSGSRIVTIKNLNTNTIDVFLANDLWDCGITFNVTYNNGFSILNASLPDEGFVNLPTASSTIIHYIPSNPTYVGNSTSATNSDTVDGIHANGLLTALSNSDKGISITVGGTTKSVSNINVNGANTILGTSPQIAAATEYNSIYVSSPGYSTNKPVKMLCFDWYGNYWAFSNIRSGDTYSAGFGVFFKNTEIARFTSDGNLSCNAASATKLQTPRTIWGQSFDGTGNVSGDLSEVGNIHFKVDNSYDIGSNDAASRYIYTSWLGARSGRKLELGANNSAFGQGLCLDTNLNVGIGTNSPAYKLHVKGDIYSSATIRTAAQNQAIRLSNDSGPAWISALEGQVIFNTGNAIRFGETAWDRNQWAGLKYTHSNKTICLGIADGSVFNSNSTLSGGTLNLRAGISNIDLNSGTAIRGLPPDGSPYSSSITLRNTSIYLSSYGDISMSTGPGVIRLNSGYGGIKLSCLGNNASIDSEGFKVEASRGAYLNSKNSGNVYLCSGGGNVGIGTTSPSYKLNVNGDARMTSITLKTIAGTYYKLPVCLACGYVYDGLSSQGYRNQAISCNIRAEILMLDSNGKYVVWFPEIIDSNYDRQRMSLLLTGCAHGLSTDGTVKAVGTLTHRGTNLAIDVWTSDDDSINPSSFYFTIWSWL